MNIRLNLKPTINTSFKNINDLRNWFMNNYGNYHCSKNMKPAQYDRQKDIVYVMNIVKTRRKSKALPSTKGRANAVDRKVVRPASLVGYVYAIPLSLLVVGKLKVTQHPRYFSLEPL